MHALREGFHLRPGWERRDGGRWDRGASQSPPPRIRTPAAPCRFEAPRVSILPQGSSGSAQSEMIARACEYKRRARRTASARDSASSCGSDSAEAPGRSVQSSVAARATQTSLTAIEKVFARRDFCDNALAAARTSANADQSDAMWDRIALLSGGTPSERSLPCILPCARQQF
jgi:hypothetical protein